MSMRYAIEKSINVVAVRTAMEIAPIDKVIDLAHKMGIKSELPNFLSLALGVGEVTPLEMTNAFGTFANEGIWVEPIAITKIEDRNGNIIEQVVPETREVLSEETAYIMTDMMEGVVNEGTASSIRQFFHRPAAGKTGTSQNYTDAWFVGYTPQFVAGCWLGFDDARVKFGGAYGQGGKAAAPIWGRFMKLLYSDENFDFPIGYFLMPDGVEEASICTITGMLANSSCPSVIDLINKKLNNRRCSSTHVIRDSLASAPIEN
jgi:penicillin-binding protein 1A